jgi:hypothetical protein
MTIAAYNYNFSRGLLAVNFPEGSYTVYHDGKRKDFPAGDYTAARKYYDDVTEKAYQQEKLLSIEEHYSIPNSLPPSPAQSPVASPSENFSKILF